MAMKLNDFLQKAILFSGKTQVQAAQEAKICPPTFNELCTGKREITYTYATRLEKVFGIPALVWMTWQTMQTIEKSKGK
jgi:plasmid maintenance system antidote protein VapI